MFKTDRIAALLLALLLGGFGAGLYALFSLRFQTGDVFPAYSSLRTDPVGVKAFCEVLDRMPGVSSRRSYRELSKLKAGPKTTVFYLGVGADFLTDLPQPVRTAMEALAEGGARVVIGFRPERARLPGEPQRSRRMQERLKRLEAKQGGCSAREGGCETGGVSPDAAALTWEVAPDYLLPDGTGENRILCASAAAPADDLEDAIPVHTALCFNAWSPDWHTLYALEDRPVLIERSFGAGSIVLAADSYLFSNEAMRESRYPKLLARLVGENREAVFDEYHLGLRESPNFMSLVRRYRLMPVLGGLIVLAGLFVWQNAVRFLPVRKEGRSEESSGRDQLSGLIHLLRRNIECKEIVKVCFDEWQKSMGRRSCRGMEERMARIRALLEDGHETKDAVTVYRNIARILSERTHS